MPCSQSKMDILNESFAALRGLEHDDEENWPLDAKPCKQNKKSGTAPTNSVHSYTKDDCGCYYNYALGENCQYVRQQDPLYQYKTSSLPAACSLAPGASWDNVICSALRVSPEDIANQLTLLDLPCFKAIQPDELTTCGWNKLNKLTVAPNVVAFTKRFNRVSFWTVQEILNGQSPKARAETMAHFIKVGKKLHELNNLHSLFAVVSALQSASIYRLSKTWGGLSKKDKQQFDRLAELFAESDNWTALREYLRSVALPCIPYLGIFLTDLTYIDIAHPAGSPHRGAKMAVVLAALRRFQSSEYEMPPVTNVATYLNSVRYIEELQKFLEDDQYKKPAYVYTETNINVDAVKEFCQDHGKWQSLVSVDPSGIQALSLKLEPPSPIGSCVGSKESMKEIAAPGSSTPYTLSPSHRLGSGSLRLHGNAGQSKFIPTHRKCRSLGSNIFGKSHTEGKMDEKTPAGSVNLLDDTLLESPTSLPRDKLSASLPHSELKCDAQECDYQGFVRRKTIMKDGRKPSLSSWQRYWLQITGNVLTFFPSKSFKGCNRNDFRSERCKVLSLDGWSAVWQEGLNSDAWQLVNQRSGTLYKFKTGAEATAKQWVAKIKYVTNVAVKPLPPNLMLFE